MALKFVRRVGHEGRKLPISSGLGGGGAERDRTADLLIAKKELQCPDHTFVCPENLNPDIVVMKSAQDRA